jgi:hypothetical protein
LPAIEPPAACPGHPVTSTLPAGSVLYRVHPADRPAHAFNPTPRPPPLPGDPVEGGRFDGIDGSYAYLYAALTEEGAFCESFVRDLDYARSGPRPLPWAQVSGKVVSTVRTRRDVELVEIQGAAAEQLGQDDWLTRCDEDAYPLTRRWAAAVRAWLPPPHRDGLGWQSKRDPQQRVVVLWGEPAGAATGCQVLEPDDATHSEALDGGFGLVRLSAFLAPWRLYLER